MKENEKILEVDNLSFRYDLRKTEKTLSAISFSIRAGEWVAVVGDNGSGKSTLARLLVGLVEPEQGDVKIDHLTLNEQSKWQLREQIGIVFQNPENQFIGTTVQDDVAFGLENLNLPFAEMKERVEQALKAVDMLDFRLSDPSQLSGGQKQRVAIASVLALQPKLIILDEAFVMLDPESRRRLFNLLLRLKAEFGLTILSITHDRNEAAMADRVLVLDQGQLVLDGTPRAVFSKRLELEPPFAEQLRRQLKAEGCQIPNQYMTEDEMVNWICK